MLEMMIFIQFDFVVACHFDCVQPSHRVQLRAANCAHCLRFSGLRYQEIIQLKTTQLLNQQS
jgi:hypothetical protein